MSIELKPESLKLFEEIAKGRPFQDIELKKGIGILMNPLVKWQLKNHPKTVLGWKRHFNKALKEIGDYYAAKDGGLK